MTPDVDRHLAHGRIILVLAPDQLLRLGTCEALERLGNVVVEATSLHEAHRIVLLCPAVSLAFVAVDEDQPAILGSCRSLEDINGMVGFSAGGGRIAPHGIRLIRRPLGIETLARALNRTVASAMLLEATRN